MKPTTLRRLLAGEDAVDLERLEPRLRAIRAVLTETSSTELVASCCPAWSSQRRLHPVVTHIDHVGFLAPPGASLERVVAAAVAAGFVETTSFGSVMVASELGRLRGRDSVPTTICRAYTSGDDGRKLGVELFLPEEPDEAIFRAWLRTGVASHAALTLTGRESFHDVKRFLEGDGFCVPAFMRGEPVMMIPQTDGQKCMTTYLDRTDDWGVLRLELCSYASVAAVRTPSSALADLVAE